MPPSRAAALEVLRLVLDGGADVQDALSRVLDGVSLSSADAGLATELAYGYLRYGGRMAAVVRSLLAAPRKTPPGLLRILELAAFELLRLTRVPAYATLDWAVARARKRYGAAIAKVANGVLRNIDRMSDELSDVSWYNKRFKDKDEALAVWYAAPVWLVRLWTAAYGPERARAYLAASLETPPLGLRVNRIRPGARELADDLAARDGLVARDGYGLAVAPGALARDELAGLVADGAVSRQSLASQQALSALEPEAWPLPVWDACCGRGGKTAHLLERSVPVLAASDVHGPRLAGLPGELRRLGLDAEAVRPAIFRGAADATALRRAPGTVLLDAPCSGLGVLSRRPDAKWRRTEAQIADLVTTQRALLLAAHDAARPGGLVAYITCTLNPAENEEQVRFLLGARPGAVLEREWSTPPSSPLREFFYVAAVRVASGA